MLRRRLPGTDIDVSVLCLGTWSFGGTPEKPDATHGFIDGGQPAINAIVAAALEAGINFFDTAEAYAGHAAERALGEALRASGVERSDFVVASKFGLHQGSVDIRYDGAAIRAALSASLQALGLDCIDLYQVHWAGNMADAAEVASALAALQQEGRIRHYGVCNFGTAQMDAFDTATAALHGQRVVTTNQVRARPNMADVHAHSHLRPSPPGHLGSFRTTSSGVQSSLTSFRAVRLTGGASSRTGPSRKDLPCVLYAPYVLYAPNVY
jgi:aryl-alcohol dehydrogenase-like predicted oxidoreductase